MGGSRGCHSSTHSAPDVPHSDPPGPACPQRHGGRPWASDALEPEDPGSGGVRGRTRSPRCRGPIFVGCFPFSRLRVFTSAVWWNFLGWWMCAHAGAGSRRAPWALELWLGQGGMGVVLSAGCCNELKSPGAAGGRRPGLDLCWFPRGIALPEAQVRGLELTRFSGSQLVSTLLSLPCPPFPGSVVPDPGMPSRSFL